MTDHCSVTDGDLYLKVFNKQSLALGFQVISGTYADAEGNQLYVDATPDVTLPAQFGGNASELIAAPTAPAGTNGATTSVLGIVAAPSGATGCTADISCLRYPGRRKHKAAGIAPRRCLQASSITATRTRSSHDHPQIR